MWLSITISGQCAYEKVKFNQLQMGVIIIRAGNLRKAHLPIILFESKLAFMSLSCDLISLLKAVKRENKIANWGLFVIIGVLRFLNENIIFFFFG